MATAASAPTAISAASVRSANAKSRYSSTPGNVEVVELADPGPGKRRAAAVPLVTHAWTGKETEQTALYGVRAVESASRPRSALVFQLDSRQLFQ